MFGWFKRRLANRVNKLADVAQIVTAIAPFSHSPAQQAPDERGKNVGLAKASAITNHFFGKTSDPVHTSNFDLLSLYDKGLRTMHVSTGFPSYTSGE